MSEATAARMIEFGLREAPEALLSYVHRLAAAKGVVAVGEAVSAVFFARSADAIRGQKHGTKIDPGGAEGRRTSALEALDAAVCRAQGRLYHGGDTRLLKALQELLPLIREAGRHASTRPPGPKGGKQGRRPIGNRPALVQRFVALGSSARKAEQIVSAIEGMRAQNIPDPPDIPDTRQARK
jgi:hypothetical protein